MDQSSSTSVTQAVSSDEFKRMWASLSLTQRRYVIARQEHPSIKSAAKSLGISPRTAYAWPAVVEEAARALMDQRLLGILTMIESAATKAAMRLDELVGSSDESVALTATRDALDRYLGKPTQRQEVKHEGELNIESATLEAALEALTKRAQSL